MTVHWPSSSAPGMSRVAAELALAEMNWFEEAARLAETSPIEDLKWRYAQTYRETVGVPHERRAEYRRALQEIVATNRGDVDEARSRFHHRNGSGDAS